MRRRNLFSIPFLSSLHAGTPTSRMERLAAFRNQSLTRLLATDEALQFPNGDEIAFPNFMGCYSKGLPHLPNANPDPVVYSNYRDALEQGTLGAIETVPLGGSARLACPLGAHSFDLTGLDSCQFSLPPAPSLASAAHAADLVELYWRCLARDVPFSDYDTHPLLAAAAQSLSRCSAYSGPPPFTHLFRGSTPGDQVGPFVSQFLWQSIPFGSSLLPQRWRTFIPARDHLSTLAEWLPVASGSTQVAPAEWRSQPRYILTQRDLAVYVWKDFSFQAFLNAALILLDWGGAAMSPQNPYRLTKAQGGFVNFGGPMVLDFVARVANAALRASWFQKWQVHRRLRPEETAARLDAATRFGQPTFLHSDLHAADVLPSIEANYGSRLLPQVYPEGCPLHPSYPAGHATIAGACITVLKVLFNPDATIPRPLEPTPDGQQLVPLTHTTLTIGGELDKLASNITFGRDSAGVHYRSDGAAGLRLGEQVARAMLADLLPGLPEVAAGR